MNDQEHPSYRRYSPRGEHEPGQGHRSPRKYASPNRPYGTGGGPGPRRAGAYEHDYSVPHAPRRRRNSPVDYAAAYNIPPERQTAFDPVDTEPEIMGEIDYGRSAADCSGPAGGLYPGGEPEDAAADDAGADPQDAGAAPGDGSPAGPAASAADGAPYADIPYAAQEDGYRRGESPDVSSRPRPRSEDECEEIPYYDLERQPSARRRSRNAPPERQHAPHQTRPRRRARTSRKARTVITVILLFIAANLIWGSIWLFNSFSLVGGRLVPLDTAELDLSGRGIHTVLGIPRLKKLERLDLSGNDISIRQYRKLAEKLPGCEITWDVPVSSSVSVSNTVSSADISSSSGIRISRLGKAVPYMTALERLDVSDCGLDEEQLWQLDRSLERVDLIWDTDLLGQRVSTDSRVVETGAVEADRLDELAEKIRYFDRLERLDLSRSGLSNDELYEFAVRNPDAKCSWGVEIFGETYASDTLELRLAPPEDVTIDDLSFLRPFYRLQALYIGRGRISDLSPLSGKLTLRILSLDNCGITDISPLKPLTGLVYLELNGNDISDLGALSGMDKLEELHLNSNNISDVSPLSGLGSLRLLNLQDNELATVSGFGDVPSLETLSLRKNQLSDSDSVSALLGISSLKMLDLQQNPFRNKVQAEIKEQFRQALPDCTLYIWK